MAGAQEKLNDDGTETLTQFRKMTTPYSMLKVALDTLDECDPDMKQARAQFGDPSDRFEPAKFDTLVRIILGQQISRAVATALWTRLIDKELTSAPTLAAVTYETLQSLGLSRRKAEYIIDLARAEIDGTLGLAALNAQQGPEVSRVLTSFRGIGGWTANNYRLFALADFDAWPGNDLALMEAVKRLKNLDARPSHKEMDKFAGQWVKYAT